MKDPEAPDNQGPVPEAAADPVAVHMPERELAEMGALKIQRRQWGRPLEDNGFASDAERAIGACEDPLARLRLARAAANAYRDAGWISLPDDFFRVVRAQFAAASSMPLKQQSFSEWGALWQQVIQDRSGDASTSFEHWNTVRLRHFIANLLLSGGSAARLREELGSHVQNIAAQESHNELDNFDYLAAAETIVWARALAEGIDREGEDFIAAARAVPALHAGVMSAQEVD